MPDGDAESGSPAAAVAKLVVHSNKVISNPVGFRGGQKLDFMQLSGPEVQGDCRQKNCRGRFGLRVVVKLTFPAKSNELVATRVQPLKGCAASVDPSK